MSAKKDKVVATLAYGKVFSKALLSVVLIGLISSIISVPGLIYWAVDESEYEVLYALLVPGLGFAIFPLVLHYYRKVSKKIKLWKKDAVKLWAKTEEVDSIRTLYLHVRKIKIRVKFYYNDKRIKQVSGEMNDMKETAYFNQVGYDSVFKKFADKRIEILYSPSYNQVMILKPAKNKKSEG